MVHHYAYMNKVAEIRKQDGKWRAAMEEEIHVLADNGTWVLVDLPKGVRLIRCRWVYKVKYNVDGSINRYKAILVAKGYAQTQDTDYDETFTPVVKITTVRVLLAITATKGWHLHQMDVKNVFLQGELEEQVYMVHPPGFRESHEYISIS